MASETLLIFVLMLSSVRVGKSAEGALFKMKCQSAVGVISQTTNICCSIESQTDPADIVTEILKSSIFKDNRTNLYSRVTDSRFKFESLPSLQLHNTTISDEGEYKYFIQSTRGTDEAEFKIRVTANYSSPIMTSEPAEIEDGGAADLYCRASGGYPAGTIHWFDQRNSNWTQNSTLQITQGHDGLFTLSSKLSFRSIDTTWTPFRCIVVNYRYEQEGENMTAQGREANYSSPIMTSKPTGIKDGGAADLYCNASGGYPAGTIHWFDQRNTNWTNNSTLQITQGHDGLFTLSSKLSFRSIDTTWGPFRCVVLNYRYEEEGENMTAQGREDDPGGDSTVKNILAAMVVIGSLIIGLLIVVLVKLKVIQNPKKATSMDLSLVNFASEPDVVEDEDSLFI